MKNNKKKNCKNYDYMKDRVNLVDNLNIEKSNNGYDKYEEDDFVPNDYHWTNIKEQKIKVGEIEEKTK